MPIVTNKMLVDCFNAKPQQLQVNLVQKKRKIKNNAYVNFYHGCKLFSVAHPARRNNKSAQ